MFDNESTPQSARPAPVQRRGVERVQAIVDAAESLLAEQGYESATLKAISERTRIPLASIYHYFKDRTQVETELLRRHIDQLGHRLDGTVSQANPESLRAAVDLTVDEYLTYARENPSFIELWFTARDTSASTLAQEFDDAQADRLQKLLVDKGLLRTDTPDYVGKLAFEAGNRLFDVAFRTSRTGDDAIIGEARRLITAYLETYG